MRKLLLAGGVVQASSALTLLTQNVLAPVLMGADAYGRAVGLVAAPLLLQGLLEPMMNGAAIVAMGRSDRAGIIGQSWRHALLWMLLALAATLFVALLTGVSTTQAMLLVGFVAMVVSNTVLRALAFAGCRYRLLALHYLAALLATFAALPFLWIAGVTGYLTMLCLVQAAVLLVLLRDEEVSRLASAVSRHVRRSASRYPLWTTYLANLSPRLAHNALGPGLLLLAGMQMSALQLAEFRLLQTLSGALGYALPVNATLLQASAGRGTSSAVASRQTGQIMLVFWPASVAVSAGMMLWLIYPMVVSNLLNLDGDAIRFHMFVLASPLYVLAPLAAGALLGRGHERYVLHVGLANLPIIIAITFFFGADHGFLWGCALYALGFGLRLIKDIVAPPRCIQRG